MRTIIFGNSASGKSSLARKLCQQFNAAHLDLDTVAWLPDSPPQRRCLSDSGDLISKFVNANPHWVIEGCYSDLMQSLLPHITDMVFMDLSIGDCIDNAKSRPWEPHKYPSKQQQDDNLAMLIDWIAQYSQRNDTFSLLSHQQLFATFNGEKQRITSNAS